MGKLLQRLDVYRTAIGMRSFEHAAAARNLAEAVVVRAQFADGSVGWGETLPRPYVTGETLDTVVADIRETFFPALAGRDIAFLPIPPDSPAPAGRCRNAAACAMDLACLGRWFPGESWNYLGIPSLAPSWRHRRGWISSRVTGVLGSAAPAKTARRLRLMRWFGLADFKLKLGLGEAIDAENLRLVHRRLGGAIKAGKCTLRVDVNGGWDAPSTPRRVAELKQYGVCAVEQPVYCSAGELAELAGRCELPLIADESLKTPSDARDLLAAGDRVWWNIRISKNGGFVPALEMAGMAAMAGVPTVLGCMVGETSILSAAQRLLLGFMPYPRFVEGNYGRFLLADDLTARSLRFGYGGKLKPLRGASLGVQVDPAKLAKYGTPAATLTA